MKVLVAHNFYHSSVPSGENTVVQREISTLRESGVNVIAFTRSSDDIPRLPLRQKLELPFAPMHSPTAVHQLRELIGAHQPDVLHLHNPYPLLSPAVVKTAKRAGVAVVQTVHNFRHRCMAAFLYRDGHPCVECLGRAGPLPGVVHGCYRGSRTQSAVMATTLAGHRALWRKLDFLVDEVGAPLDAVTVKPNAAPDPGRIPPGGAGMLFLGRLSSEKGIDLLLEAWMSMPAGDLRLTIAGDGPLKSQVVAAAAQREDISYAGRLDESAAQQARERASVVVVPSTWAEICPLVVIEAMASSRAVLGTALGGLPWLIGDGGWVVAPEASALAERIARLRESPAAVGATQRAARKRFEDVFAPAGTADALVAVYSRAIARHRQEPSMPT